MTSSALHRIGSVTPTLGLQRWCPLAGNLIIILLSNFNSYPWSDTIEMVIQKTIYRPTRQPEALWGATEPLFAWLSPTLRKPTKNWFNGAWVDIFFLGLRLCFLQPVCNKLRENIQRFNTERLEVAGYTDDVVVITLTNSPKHKDLVKNLYLIPPEDFDDIMDKAKDHFGSGRSPTALRWRSFSTAFY